ncbi:putative nucleic acid-binding protein [Halopolyspora algeriensis]|uniref:Ribonuclease VapC n=1 Tax=Halopolyspora algeriensis TaxID=1500506 RepID=A0A368VK80_9ACTN|nr:type II toxin-antitoxin system VapC family toxin [Halopolyspora algeriensis]RCW40058.1 putative nucleic acid-binding protein [Halopolyspora algeriensis]TQM56793.1 putative nucleic acid-binding protein [Halopolyspora algeriensis]
MSAPSKPEAVVLDASVAVDLLAGTDRAPSAHARLSHTELHAPAHLDAEVLSALGRLYRAGELAATDVDTGLTALTTMPVSRHPVIELAADAWTRRDDLRLVDALYVALATRLGVPLITTDLRLARACSVAEALPVSE